MAQEISIPVKLQLQNLQNIIKELEGKLSNLKVGTSGFKSMQTTLYRLQQEADKLQNQISKPFINERQFDATARSIDKIEDKVNQLQINLSRIKFSDLNLNEEQQAQLDNFNNRIEGIQNSLTKLKNTAKSNFLASDAGKMWSEMDPSVITKSFEQITRNIEREVSAQQKAVNKAEENLKDYQRAMDISNAAKKMVEAKDPLKEGLGQDFDKFFNINKNNVMSFKSGTRPLFEEWLVKNFEIDPNIVHELVQKSASEISKELKNAQSQIGSELNKKINGSEDARKALQDYENLRNKLNDLKTIQAKAAQENKNIGTSEKELQGDLKTVNSELTVFKERLAEAARGDDKFKSTCVEARSQLENFRKTLNSTNTDFLQQQRTMNNFNSIKMLITNFMGFTQVLNLTKRAVRDALNHIKELDSVMNKISIVTDMSTGDLWEQVDAYSDMAQKYGVSIKGAYEVSQIYYQQGLKTKDVLTLTNETLKLAKISGLDYAASTDYMTTALRGFKMEMSEASTIVDVYSNLAAHTAVTQEELAVAMSKTASSLQSVGSSFEESSAMIATMVAVTRESATNIGSALKSIAARYGEMKSDPSKLIDSEGEIMAYNKVDAALQSVGITLKTTDGQFRSFTDVILELSEVWDQLDSTQQRYIATQFAGNRQQSRFLALVSNKDLLKQNLETAENSEDTGTIQALKTLDSIESKTEQVRVAYQQLYTTIGVEKAWGGLLDILKNVINTMNGLPKLFGKIPIGAIAMAYDFINVIKTLGLQLLSGVSKIWTALLPKDLPSEAGHLAEQVAEIFSKTLADKIASENPGGKMANKVNEQAEKASQDKNEPAGDKKTVEKAAEPAQNTVENAVKQMEATNASATATANSTKEMADNLGHAADAAERGAAALKSTSGVISSPVTGETNVTPNVNVNLEELKAKIEEQSTALGLNKIQIEAGITLADDLSGLGPDITSKIQEQLNSIDFSTPDGVEKFKEAMAQLRAEAESSGVDLSSAFQKAGNMGIQGLLLGLADDSAVTQLASKTGWSIIMALREGMGVHSPSVPAQEATKNVIIGAVNGLYDNLSQAIEAAKASGTSIIDAMKQVLEKSSIDISPYIQLIPKDIDISKVNLDELSEKLTKQVELVTEGAQDKNFTTSVIKDKKQNFDRLFDETYKDLRTKNNTEFWNSPEYKRYQQAKSMWDGHISPEKAQAEYLQAQNMEKLHRTQVAYYSSDEYRQEQERFIDKSIDSRYGFSQMDFAERKFQKDLDELDEEKEKERKDLTWKSNNGPKAQRKQAQDQLDTLEGRYATKRQHYLEENNVEAILAENKKKREQAEIERAAEKEALSTKIAQKIEHEKSGLETEKKRVSQFGALAENPESQLTTEQQKEWREAQEGYKRVKQKYDEQADAITQSEQQAKAMLNKSFSQLNGNTLTTTMGTAMTSATSTITDESTRREDVEKKRQEEEEEQRKQQEEAERKRQEEEQRKQQEAEQEKLRLAAEKKAEQERFEKSAVIGREQWKKIETPVSSMEDRQNKFGLSTQNQHDLTPIIHGMPQPKNPTDKEIEAAVAEYKESEVKAKVKVEADTEVVKEKTAEAVTEIESNPAKKPIEAETAPMVEKTEADEKQLEAEPIEKKVELVDSSISSGSIMDQRAAGFGLIGQTDRDLTSLAGATITGMPARQPEPSADEVTAAVAAYKAETEAAKVQAPEITGGYQKGKQSGTQAAEGIEEGVKAAAPEMPDVQNAEQKGAEAGQKAAQSATEAFQTPELGASLDTVVNLGTGDALNTADIDNLLTKLQQAGTISEETKAKLLDLYNTKPSEEFVNAYSNATDTAGTIASANMPMEMATFTPLPQETAAASPVPEFDTSAQVAQLEALIDKLAEMGVIGEASAEKLKQGLSNLSPEELTAKMQALNGVLDATGTTAEQTGSKLSKINFGTIGSAIRMLASITSLSKQAKGAITALGGAITLLGVLIQFVDKSSKTAAKTNPWMAIATGILAVINGLSMLIETDEQKLERLTKEAEELSDKAKQAKADSKELEISKKKLEELEEKRYDSAEAAEEYQHAVDDLTTKFPGLIQGFDEAGDAILNISALEDELTDAREKAAQAAYDAAQAERKKYEEQAKQAQSTITDKSNFAGPSSEGRSEYEGQVGVSELAVFESGHWLSDAYTTTHANRDFKSDLIESTAGNSDPLAYFKYLKNQTEQALGRVQYYDITYNSRHRDDSSIEMYKSLSQLNLGANDELAKLNEMYQLMQLVRQAGGTDKLKIADIPEPLRIILGIDSFDEDEYFKDWTDFKEIDTSWLEEESQIGQELFEVLELIITSEKKLASPEGLEGSTSLLQGLLKDKKLNNKELLRYTDDVALVAAAVKAYESAVDAGDWETAESAFYDLRTIQNAVNSSTDKNLSYLQSYFAGIDDTLDEIGPLLGQADTSMKSAAVSSKSQISNKLNQVYSGYQKFFDDKSGLTAIITDRIYSEFEDAQAHAKLEGKVLNFDDWLSDNADQLAVKYAEIMESFWTTLSSSDQELLTTMLKNTDKYSFEDIISTFNIDPETELGSLLKKYYDGAIERIKARLTKKISNPKYFTDKSSEERSKLEQTIHDFYDKAKFGTDFTAQEETYLNKSFDTMMEFADAGYSDMAAKFGDRALEFYDKIKTLSATQKAKVLEWVNTNGLNTSEGINQIIALIQADTELTDVEKAELINKLNDTQRLLITNIGLELQTAVDNYLNKWKDASKTLKKLSSGIDIADVEGIIQSDVGKAAGITFDSFITDGEKLILKADEVDRYIEEYFATERLKIQQYSDQLKQALGGWGRINEEGKIESILVDTSIINQDAQKQIESIIGIGNLQKYAHQREDGMWVVDNAEELNKAIQTGYQNAQDSLVSYGNYLDWSQEQVIKTIQWKRGDYTSLKKIFGFSEEDNVRLEEKLKSLISGNGFLELYADTPDVKSAVTKIRKILSTFMSDVIAKGPSNIDLSDYEGLPDWIAEEFKRRVYESNYQFAQAYVQYLGGTVEESNAMIIAALDKDHAQTSNDAIKDLTFFSEDQFSATSSELKQLASTYNLDLAKLFAQGFIWYDEALREYVVDYAGMVEANLAGDFDLSAVEGFHDTVQDSMREFFKKLGDLVKKGLSGSLSNTELTTLKETLSSYGVTEDQLKLTFTETAQGLKLSTDSAIRLYTELSRIDDLQGVLTFDELSKSLQENNEHYKTLSSLTAHIVSLRKALADESIDPKRREQYQKELELAEKIKAVRSTTEDSSFSFMSNKIPGMQNNPLNYWKDWSTAWQTITASAQSGYMDYTQFYNILTEMGHMAEVGGTEIDLGAGEFVRNAADAARLIEEGAGYLEVTADGSVQVNLSNFGIGFLNGSEDMKKNIGEAIKTMAESQIKMIDGMIKLLETIVKMQEIGDIIDEDKSGTIDLDEVFDVKRNDETGAIEEINSFTKTWNEQRDKLLTFLNSTAGSDMKSILEGLKAKWGNEEKSLFDLLQFNADDIKDWSDEQKQQYAEIIKMVYAMANSDEFDPDNLAESIQSIFAGSSLSGEIPLGDTTLVLTHGKTMVKNKNGKYEVDGTEYGTLTEALEASLQAELENAARESDNITFTENAGTITLGTDTISFTVEKGKIKIDGGEYYSLTDYYKERFKKQFEDGTYSSMEEMEVDQGLKVYPKITTEEPTLSDDAKERLKAANITSWKKLKAEWDKYGDDQKYKFVAKYHVDLTEVMEHQEDWADDFDQQLKDLAITVDNSQAMSAIQAVQEALKTIEDKTVTLTIKRRESITRDADTKNGDFGKQAYEYVGATGNIGIAKSKGTLLGELGPEMVVSDGRYFIAGQNGPEMMNLADDAIVFNHLQTKSLLEKGTSSGRGRAITNERNAIAYAKGSINGGPAMASAAAALKALKELRAQWQAIAKMGAQDFASKGGGGGGGSDTAKAFLKDLEKWYDWLQQIAQLEKEITLEEAKRAKYQSDFTRTGKDYYTSQIASLDKLKEQVAVQMSLNASQEEYYKKRIAELNNQSAFSALYGFSEETGQLYYKDIQGGKNAYEWLAELSGRDAATGKANYTVEQQYNELVKAGFGEFMRYDSSGNEIDQKDFSAMVQAFWDKVEADQSEAQSLHDSIEDGKNKVLELENQRNEILHEIEDNQIAVEQKVFKAVEEAAQREIDELKDQRDAIDKQTKALTDGLRKQLENERTMYQNQKNDDEFASLQRRLAILQRSGGSASEIADLQQQISDKQYDMYFDAQEQQIQAIQDASDAELERLDNQIELMQETLNYSKEHGLLWQDVDAILQRSPEEIAAYIQENTKEYWGQSTTELAKTLREDMFAIDRYKEFEKVNGGMDALIAMYNDEQEKKAAEEKTKEAEQAKENTGNTESGTTSGGSSGTPSGNTGGTGYKYKKEVTLSYIDQDYGTKQVKVTGVSNVSEAKAIENGKAKALEKAKKQPGYRTAGSYRYASGGLNEVTGPAWLDGTKQNPEAVLNAEQTRILRNNILGNRPDSLVNLLASYNESYKAMQLLQDKLQMSSLHDDETEPTVIIERAEVNLNIDKLANDYDSKRAATTIMDEMLRIASKTSASNSVRR